MSKLQGIPTYYRPDEVATMLRCSSWWVKEQARKNRIPFSWIGGSYLFTAEHIAEIVALFEQRPTSGSSSVQMSVGTGSAVPARRSRTVQPVVQLKARPPRRTRAAGGQNAA